MSKYTTTVRFICEEAAGWYESKGLNDIDEALQAGITKIFDFDFPLYDPTYKNVLCKKILMHFYTREICEETVGLWKLRLMSKLNDIMPLYNEYYEAAALKFNPFYNVDMSKVNSKTLTSEKQNNATNVNVNSGTGENKTNSNQSEANTSSSNDTSLYSDTPQGAITGLETGKYLTNAQLDKNNTTAITSGDTEQTQKTLTNTVSSTDNNENEKFNTLESYIEHIYGNNGGGNYSDLLLKYRKTFINIDKMVIDELEDLFFMLWE